MGRVRSQLLLPPMHLPALLTTSALVLCPPGVPHALQVGGAPPREEEPLPLRNPLETLRRELSNALAEGIVGCWQLDGFAHGGLEAPRDEIEGYALFADGYLGLVIHAIGYDEANAEEVAAAQAGLFRYRIDEHGRLQTSTVIGHSNPFGDVEFERPGELREYALEQRGDLLALSHRDGTVLRFSRVLERSLTTMEIARLAAEEAAEAAQDAAGSGPPELAPLLAFRAEQRRLTQESVTGSWRLTSFRTGGEEAAPGEILAHALFGDGYLALVMHAIGYDAANAEEAAVVQAGLFRFRFDELGGLQTSTLIGHSNPFGEVDWDEPGELREYRVEYEPGAVLATGAPSEPRALLDRPSSESLALLHADGTVIRFARSGPGGLGDREVLRIDRTRGVPEFDEGR